MDDGLDHLLMLVIGLIVAAHSVFDRQRTFRFLANVKSPSSVFDFFMSCLYFRLRTYSIDLL